MLKSSKTQ